MTEYWCTLLVTVNISLMLTTLELNASQSIRFISLQVLETRYQTHQLCSQSYGWQII